jgi:hypothetical protein
MGHGLQVQGYLQDEDESRGAFDSRYDRDVENRIHQRVTTQAGGARGRQTNIDLDGDEDDILEIETADGVVHFTTMRQAQDEARRRGSAQLDDLVAVSRDTGPVVGVTRSSFAFADPDLKDAFAQLQGSLARTAIEGAARVVLEPAARRAMKRLADWLDRPVSDSEPAARRRKGPKERGLYRVDHRLLLEPENRLQAAPSAEPEPFLLLLHGTFSHTEAAFAGLRGTPEWLELYRRYDGRVLALEHATLGKTPAENALDLARLLPAKARLHLLSHSRGGLIGEALTLATRPVDLALYDDADGSPDHGALPELHDRMDEVRIERFVRAACPAAGTILASRRVDQYASYMFNLLRMVPGLQGTGVVETVKLLLLMFLDQRSDPRTIPGLEAQMPESAFIRTLNTTSFTAGDAMAAVAGDIQGAGLAQRLKVFGADLFFREDHDMVVNTSAMVAGVKRSQPRVAFFKGPGYSHSSYFSDQASRAATCRWLSADVDTVPGFEAALPARRRSWWGRRDGAAGLRGTVIVVPDLLGTEIKIGPDRVWPEPARLARDLRAVLESEAWEPSGLTAQYQPLLEALSRDSSLEEFGYDGRAPLRDTARRLRERIERLLRSATPPVHVVAHGAGCRIVRLVHEAWPGMPAETGGRIVLLSPPLEGTALATARREGRDVLSAALAVVSGSEPTAVGQLLDETFPSLAELASAPHADDPHDGWESYLAVYGHAARTLVSDADGQLAVSSRGDGHVPWPDTPEGPATRVVPVPFHRLVSDPEPVQVVREFLAGRTPAERRSTPRDSIRDVRTPAPPRHLVLFPTEADLVWMGMGAPEEPPADKARLDVRVVHGNLIAARERLVVGTQQGTPIGGAEKALDERLEGALSRHRLLGQYPGPLGTCQMFVMPGATARSDMTGPGAAVIGLGGAGDLSPSALTAGVANAVLRLVAAMEPAGDPVDDEDAVAGEEPAPEHLDLGTVLIGTAGAGALPVSSSVTAIITGVRRANRRVRDLRLPRQVRRLTIYEVYDDRAIEALSAVGRLAQATDSGEDELRVAPERVVEGVDGRPGSPRTESLGDRWRTIRVSLAEKADDDADLVALTFTEIGRTAGVPSPITRAQRRVVDQLVEQSIGNPVVDEQIYNTLYELLVPRSMKGQGLPSEHIMYLLHPRAASLPLEMLATRSFDDGIVPLGIEVGLVRRLESQGIRDLVRPASAHKALVVGDPWAGVGMLRLPAAVREATLVADLLETRGWEVNRVISHEDDHRRIDAQTVLNALFAHEYRIIHIAGHGNYDGEATRSGVCIGPDLYLTSYELEQMQTTPDLVFLNCCHSGSGVDRPDRLAASVSQKLIDNGVRVVVAAGWAVDDEAASAFAGAFYDALLNGDYLGTAALAARRRVYAGYGRSTNTWGAYHVYGEPAFQIVRDRKRPEHSKMLARRDFRERLQELTDRASMAQTGTTALMCQELAELAQRGAAHGWLTGEEHQALGQAWRALGDFEKAAESYRDALDAGGTAATLSIVSQLVGVHAFLGANHATGDPGCRTDHFAWAERLLDTWRDLLAAPPQLGACSGEQARASTSASTAELLKSTANLRREQLWAACKARESAESPDGAVDLLKALRRARDAFIEADEAYLQVAQQPDGTQGPADQYARLGRIVFTWLALQYDSQAAGRAKAVDADPMPALAEMVRKTRAAAEESAWSTKPFERLRIPDAALVSCLLLGEPGFAEVRRSYRRVFDRGLSMRERDTVCRFVELVECSLPCDGAHSELRRSLRALHEWLVP